MGPQLMPFGKYRPFASRSSHSVYIMVLLTFAQVTVTPSMIWVALKVKAQSLSLPMLHAAGQHWSLLVQAMICDVGFPHIPAAQVVPDLQPLPSSHAMPLFAGTPPTHLPAEHVSPDVQPFLSSQGAPSFPGMATQVCMTSLHTPTMH